MDEDALQVRLDAIALHLRGVVNVLERVREVRAPRTGQRWTLGERVRLRRKKFIGADVVSVHPSGLVEVRFDQDPRTKRARVNRFFQEDDLVAGF